MNSRLLALKGLIASAPARVALLTSLALGSAVMIHNRAPWRGELLFTVEWFGASVPVVGAMSAGLVAWQCYRLDEPQRGLLATMPRRGAALVSSWLAITGAIIAGQAVVLAASLAISLAYGASGGPPVLAILIALAGLAAMSGIGLLIGAAFRGRFAAPIAAGSVLWLAFFSNNLGLPDFFNFGSGTTTLVGLIYNRNWALIQLTFLIAVLTLALFYCASVSEGSRLPSAARRAGLLLCCLALALPIVQFGSMRPARFATAAESEPRCISGSPVICIHPIHMHLSDTVTTQLRSVYSAAIEAGVVTLPTRFVESPPFYSQFAPGQAYFLIQPETFYTRTFDTQSAVTALIHPIHCPSLREVPPPEAMNRAQDVLAGWLGARRGVTPTDYFYQADIEAFLSRPPGDQLTWVNKAIRTLQSCRFGEIPPL